MVTRGKPSPYQDQTVMIAAVLAALALGSPSAQGAPGAGPPVESVTAASDADKIVCRRTAVTGSRLGGEKVCLTKAQWVERQRSDGDTLREVQTRASKLRPQ